MTRRLALLGLLIPALVAGRADAATVTLTDQWQNLGTGPLLISVLNGDGLFEASAGAPTDNGLPIFRNQQPFAFNATQSIWAKRRSTSASPVAVTTAITVGGGGSGGGGSAADQTASNATSGQATSTNNQHGLAYEYIYNGATWDQARGVNGVRYVLPQDVRQTGLTLSAAANSTLVVPVNGAGTLGLSFSGLTASGATITFSASNDGGTTYTAVGSFNAATGAASPTYATDGQTRIDVGGRTNLKLTVTTGGTGTITVGATASPSPSLTANTSPLVAQSATGRDIGAVEQFGAPWAVSWSGQTVGITGTVQLGAGTAAVGSVSVSNFPTTQAVSGTVAATQSGTWTVAQGAAGTAKWPVDGSGVTQPISASALPLPTGAATSALQSNVQSASGTAATTLVGVQGNSSMVPLQVTVTNPSSGGGSSGSVTAAGTNGTTAQAVQGINGGVALPVSGTFFQATQPVSAASLPLPAGAATAANQNSTAAGTSAANAQGVQGVTGGVALASNLTQQAGTALGAPTAYGTAPTGNVAGVNANVLASVLPAGAATAANQPTSATQGSTTSGQTGTLHMCAVLASAPTYTTAQSLPITCTLAGALRVDGSAVTQPISAAALPLPTGAATAANQFALSYQLLNNATATGATFTAVGGNYLLALSGTFGGATVTINSTTNGVTTVLGTYTAAPATPPQFTIATGAVVQAVVSGGTPSALYATLGGIGAATTATAGGASASTITSTQGAVTNPADVAVAANTVTTLLSTTSRKFMSLTNVGTGNCRVAYNGITPTTTRGDPLNAATTSGLGGGSRTFEASYVPTGTVSAICAAASSFSVIEGQ